MLGVGIWLIVIQIGSCVTAGPYREHHIPHELLATSEKDEGDTSLGRLPTALYPTNYQLELKPDIYTGAPPFYFNGSVSIRFGVTDLTNIVYLNSVGLTILDVSIRIAPDSPVTGPDPEQIRWELDEPLQFFKLYLEDYLRVGAEYIITLDYTGTMNAPSNGFGLYWNSFDNLDDGQTNYFAVTLFWPHSGRQIVPSFDEPQLKATFDVTLLRKDNVVALANMDSVAIEDRGDGWVAETFNTTVLMTTYTQCFVIGNFEYLESYTSRGTRVRVWSRPDYVQDLVYANQVAAGIQESHETWTDSPDPLNKMDHIAIPGFAGAMESWGLITYQESALVYNETYNTLDNQRTVAFFLAHELAHHWFGNLVTFRWWNDAWLNEGFATYFENLPLDEYLGWGEETEIQAFASLRAVMQSDSNANSDPIIFPVDSPWQSFNTFTTYTYNKGGAMLRMLKQILGEGGLKRGLRRYLTRFQYSNAVTDDLWAVLTEQAEIEGIVDSDGGKLFIKEKMDPWLYQRGYPIVSLDRVDASTVNVTQTQFLSPPGQNVPNSPFDYEWFVPLTITNEVDLDFGVQTQEWLNRDNKTTGAGLPPSTAQWYIANVNQSGFFRTRYDSATYGQITQQLETDALVFPTETRFGIMNDAIELTGAGLEPETYMFESTRGLAQEDSYSVWQTADLALEYPAAVLARYPTTFTAFTAYLRSKLDPTYTRIGWQNDPAEGNLERNCRALVLSLSCAYNNSDCHQQSITQFQALMADPLYWIYVDHRTTVYCTAMEEGSQTEWDFLHSRYLQIADDPYRSAPPEIQRILFSLACTLDDTLIQRYINMTFDPASFRSGNAIAAIEYIAESTRGRFVMYDHLKTNWNNDPLPPGASKTNTLLDVVEGFATDADLAELQSFIALHPPQDAQEQNAYNDAVAMVQANIDWAAVNEQPLNDWFLANTV